MKTRILNQEARYQPINLTFDEIKKKPGVYEVLKSANFCTHFIVLDRTGFLFISESGEVLVPSFGEGHGWGKNTYRLAANPLTIEFSN